MMKVLRCGVLTSTCCRLILIGFFFRQAFRTLCTLGRRGRILIYDIITFAVSDVVIAVVEIGVADDMSAGVFSHLVDDKTH